MIRKSDAAGSVLTFVVGVGIGAAAALLFAPKSGGELRADLAQGANDGIDQVRKKGKQVRDRANEVMDIASDRVQEALEAGQIAYKQASRI
jgi:gas vesicle protein